MSKNESTIPKINFSNELSGLKSEFYNDDYFVLNGKDILKEIYNNSDLSDEERRKKICGLVFGVNGKGSRKPLQYYVNNINELYKKYCSGFLNKTKKFLSSERKKEYGEFKTFVSEVLDKFKKMYGDVHTVDISKFVPNAQADGGNFESEQKYKNIQAKEKELEDLRLKLGQSKKCSDFSEKLRSEVIKKLHLNRFGVDDKEKPSDILENIITLVKKPEDCGNVLKSKLTEKLKSEFRIANFDSMKQDDRKAMPSKVGEILDKMIEEEKEEIVKIQSNIKLLENEVKKLREEYLKNAKQKVEDRDKRYKKGEIEYKTLESAHYALLKSLEKCVKELGSLNKKMDVKSSGGVRGFGSTDKEVQDRALDTDKKILEECKNYFKNLVEKFNELSKLNDCLTKNYRVDYLGKSPYLKYKDEIEKTIMLLENVDKNLAGVSGEIRENLKRFEEDIDKPDNKYKKFADECTIELQKREEFAKTLETYYIFDTNMDITASDVKQGKLPQGLLKNESKYTHKNQIRNFMKATGGQLQTCLKIAMGESLITQYKHNALGSSYYKVIDESGNVIENEAAKYKGCINKSLNEQKALKEVQDAMKNSLKAGEWKTFK